jgi:hypothetical protein
MSANPPLVWAQDKTRVFVTIKLYDVLHDSVQFDPHHFHFTGEITNPATTYDYLFELFEEIVPNDTDTKCVKLGRSQQITLRKRDSRIWWPRLGKTTQKLHNVSIDWDRWIEDEVDAPNAGEGEIELPNTADADFTSSDTSSDNDNDGDNGGELETVTVPT